MSGLAKGLAVIETFTAQTTRQSISQVSSASELDRATARRCLLTLAHLGFADYDGKFFTLTPRIMRLGAACLGTMPLPQIVQPLLDALSDELGESASVSILDGEDIVYVARSAQRKVMSISLTPGSRLPAYCTSMGRVLWATDKTWTMPDDPFVARTKWTITEKFSLSAELDRVREQGFAVINQEVEIGLISIAVPVFDARRRVVAALNVGVSTHRATADELPGLYLQKLIDVQTELRALLMG